MQRSCKGALRQFSAKVYLTAIFDANMIMQGGDKSEVVHVSWLRLLPKPDDPSTHKTIKCSSYCSCFKLISDIFSISYYGPSLRYPKAVMLLLSLVLWANSINPVITVEEDTHLFLPVYHMTQQHATVWLQTMTNRQLLATRICDYHVVMLWWYHLTTFISVKSTHLAQQHFQKDSTSVSIHPTPLRGRYSCTLYVL